jgi:hypothetical protein
MRLVDRLLGGGDIGSGEFLFHLTEAFASCPGQRCDRQATPQIGFVKIQPAPGTAT